MEGIGPTWSYYCQFITSPISFLDINYFFHFDHQKMYFLWWHWSVMLHVLIIFSKPSSCLPAASAFWLVCYAEADLGIIWQAILMWSNKSNLFSLTINESKFCNRDLHLLRACTVTVSFLTAISICRAAKSRAKCNVNLRKLISAHKSQVTETSLFTDAMPNQIRNSQTSYFVTKP